VPRITPPNDADKVIAGLNRGKRSLTLDLKDPADQQLAHELCRRADVIFESFRPGTMDRLGLGWEAVRQYNPRAIYTSISAFGSSDEGAALPGYDLLVQAMSGYMSITGAADGPAMKPGTALIDLATGLYAATGTLAALQERERSGEGQHVEVALLDSALAMLLNVGSGFLNTGELPARTGNAHPSIAPYQTFPTATGDLALAVGNDAIFTRFCDAIGQPEIATDSRFATNSERVVHRDALIAILSEIFADESAEIWTERLTAAGVPAGPVNDVAQAYEFADALGLEPIVELEGVRSTRSPMRLSRTPAVPQSRPPRLGEHNDELRAWLSEG
jgi:crotonobetainyl-CoA:carnitine CoA-transferase CaiB-like acyl-CoA transferase